MNRKGVSPIKSVDRDSSGEHYWKCPICKNRVGGFVYTGKGTDPWIMKRINFVKTVAQK